MSTVLEDEFAGIILEVVKHRAHFRELLLLVSQTSVDDMVDALAHWQEGNRTPEEVAK